MKIKAMVKTAVFFLAAAAAFSSCGKSSPKITLESGVSLGVVSVPDNNFCIAKTEVTQEFYEAVMG
ncbi:MAG: hypothetical protein J6S81_04190, partial [Treponema sp.]|nr:hypothetical protein [Treponema sp.]